MGMGASTGKPDNMIGSSKPIIQCQELDKICVLLLLLEYTLLQLIMRILRRFTERKRIITLFVILSTWVPLCDGHRRGDAVVPFQSRVRHGNTVMGITRWDDGAEWPSPGGHYRPGCPPPGRDLCSKDGSNLGFPCLHFDADLWRSTALSFPTHFPVVYLPMSSSGGDDQRNDAVTGAEMERLFCEVVREINDESFVWLQIRDHPSC